MDNNTAGQTSTSFPYPDDDIASWLYALEVPVCVALDSAYVPVVLAAVQRDRQPLHVIHVRTVEDGFVVAGVPITGRIVYYPANIPSKYLAYLAALQELGVVLRELPALEDWGMAFYFPGSLLEWLQREQEPTAESQAELLAAKGETFEWPTMADDAYYGLAGAFCTRLDAHTESDKVALLIQFLTYFGTMLGRTAHFRVEATTHHSNLFSCLVGDTSKARKGTSYDHVENLLKSLDPTWKHDDQVISGCGSGEGIIYAVRDPTITSQPVKEKGRVVDYQEVITDHGVTDKRLLILEPEFVSVLKIGEREGNTLSPILRNAWDGKTLQNTVKTSPMKATNPHISVIGHITLEELQRSLTTTDMANGFANRFLWLCVKRSKYLPHGGKAHTLDWADFYKHLKKALTDAQHTREMHRSDLANIAWEAVYTPLSQGSVGLVGAITARAEAQVLRLSCLYALLDGQDTITEQHLYAALAVWQYAEESARYIFGQMVGDARAERLLTALDMAADEGLTRKQIYNDVFQNNLKAGELDILLQTLESQQHIRRELYTPPLGRPGHKYFLLPKSLRTNVLSPPSLLNIAKKAVLEAKSLYVTPNVLSTDKVETSGVSTYLVRKSEKSAEQATEPPNGVSTFIKLVRRPFCVHTLAPLGEGYVCSTCGTLFDDQDAAESGAGTDELL